MALPTIEVRQGDVTEADVDVLVNASNTELALGSGVSAAIRRACGPGYQEEIHAALERSGRGSMPPGSVLITGAGTHPRATHVAHVAVMDYRAEGQGDARPDHDRIRMCSAELWRALEALDREVSVGMVALGAGTGGLGVRVPTEIACETLKEHLAQIAESRIRRVIFHGWAIHEFAAVISVVRKHFAIDTQAIDPQVMAFVDASEGA